MPDLYALAKYFQKQADRTRNPDRKMHYQRCADEARWTARAAEQKAKSESHQASESHTRDRLAARTRRRADGPARGALARTDGVGKRGRRLGG
jgi:hypothetical protein